MSTVLLAVGDESLAAVLQGRLKAAGHTIVRVRRPLALLTEARRTAWDIVFVDDSSLGKDALVVLPGIGEQETPIVGAGLEDLRVSRSLSLPLEEQSLMQALDALTGRGTEALVLRPERRVAQAHGREVTLTRSEFRLLQALWASRPREVSIAQAMEAVWGESAGSGTPPPLRSHVRNLRQKLSQIGLADSLRSRRGRGYSLAL